MLKFTFNKLVRDKIVQHQIDSGAKPHYHRLDSSRHKAELIKKIIEEAQEISSANQENIAGEIADVQQAVDDLKAKLGLSDVDIAKAQKAKNDKNGSFKNGIFVDYVELADDDEWVAYYKKNADRYPEIK
jgi:predicted house-cleaning noncanonical NTP pyrophosphatase (MazG superfamily)